METNWLLSQEDINENPAQVPSVAKAITASPFFIFSLSSSGDPPEIPVPLAMADDKVTSQISFIQKT
ncbi:hypothetical protein [Flavobacterium johnsoniae]|uniref:hypothetical protein n=1 Tax=Flavobacterium johnsoniae TaxID=986 RepID=UPI003D6F7107